MFDQNMLQQIIPQMLPQLKNNPAQFMQQYGANPQGMDMTNPQSMASALASSGFCDQQTLNFAQGIARAMGYKL